MATSTELLRAAEHMDSRAHLHRLNGMHTAAFDAGRVAHLLRDEAERIQGLEARLNNRSWPEGWPPFAVLRRAYSATGMHHYPSTRVCERSRVRSHRAVAAETRARWQRVLLQVLSDPSSP